jgi:hypothetical protein
MRHPPDLSVLNHKKCRAEPLDSSWRKENRNAHGGGHGIPTMPPLAPKPTALPPELRCQPLPVRSFAVLYTFLFYRPLSENKAGEEEN